MLSRIVTLRYFSKKHDTQNDTNQILPFLAIHSICVVSVCCSVVVCECVSRRCAPVLAAAASAHRLSVAPVSGRSQTTVFSYCRVVGCDKSHASPHSLDFFIFLFFVVVVVGCVLRVYEIYEIKMVFSFTPYQPTTSTKSASAQCVVERAYAFIVSTNKRHDRGPPCFLHQCNRDAIGERKHCKNHGTFDIKQTPVCPIHTTQPNREAEKCRVHRPFSI